MLPLAISQDVIGEPREDHVVRLHSERVLPCFPRRHERSRSTRRTRDLWAVILAVRVSVQIVLDALALEETAISDSAPVPCVGDKRSTRQSDVLGVADDGVCCCKARTDVGCTLHGIVSRSGGLMSFVLTPANTSEHQPVVEVLDSFCHHLTHVLGDGADNDAQRQQCLRHARDLAVVAPVTVNQPPVRSQRAQQQRTCVRLLWETVTAQRQEQWHVSKHAAKSIQGLLPR